jgi:hypothetical protein
VRAHNVTPWVSNWNTNPKCEEYSEFWKVASTRMHLGWKVKWHCGECDYGFVRIDGEVDTAQTA